MVEGHVAGQAVIFHCPIIKAKQAAQDTERGLFWAETLKSRCRGLFGPSAETGGGGGGVRVRPLLSGLPSVV